VLFGTPAETRELGGFVGNFAELTADKGKLSLARTGRVLELSDPRAELGRTLAPGDYLEPFAPYRVEQFFGNVSASPNFPDVANVVDQLYPQTGGAPIDGVFYMDPYALAALLDLTGPVTLSGTRTKISSKNAAQTLLVDQYLEPHTDVERGKRGEKDQRVDFLEELTRVTFDRLTSGDLPKPVTVADVMNPMVEQGRLFGQSSHPQIEALFQQLGLDGSIPSRNGGDYLSVTQSNDNPSKIDAYLQRDVTYDATYFPDSGQVTADLHVRFTNSAPAALLPDDVIGNANGLPPGTNRLLLTVYSPLGATGATINGVPAGVGSVKRFGLSAYTVTVEIPSGATADVEFKLSGIVDRARQYQLTVVRQPTVNSDHIDVTLHTKDDWHIASFPGFQLEGGVGKASVGVERSTILTAHLDTR
jgi:hypothetical protein